MKYPEVVEEALKIHKPPFKYDPNGFMVLDSDNNLVVDVRGWGHIQHLKDDETEALKLHDTVGELIAAALNEKWEKEKSS
jgi:hypothetical protein